MTTMQTVLAVVMILASLFLTFTILMQSGSRQGMSGTISGGAETFFGSGKAKGMDAMLNKLTIVVAIVFVALAVILNVLQEASPCGNSFKPGRWRCSCSSRS